LSQKHAYHNLVESVMDVAKTPSGNQAADLFFKKLTMMGREPKINTNADPTKIQFLEKSAFGWAILKPLGFMDVDGITLFPVINTTTGIPDNKVWFQIDMEGQLYSQDNTNMSAIVTLGQPVGYLP
jgi:hypothetical protein